MDQQPLIIEPQLPTREDHVVLTDGRHLAWSEWGPSNGRAVIFCTGAGMSGSFGFAEACLERLNARLIAIDRPGLGRSHNHVRGTLQTWAEDVSEMIQERDLGDAVAVGFSQGAPFALQLAASGLSSAVAVVSGQDDFSHRAVSERLDPQVRGMIESLCEDQIAFSQTIKAANPDWLWSMILAMSSNQDQTIYSAEGFATAYQRSLREGFSQGPDGYVRDLINTWSPWPFLLENLSVAVDLWYGALDGSPVHSPDFGRTMAERIPRSNLFLEEGEGGSLLWTQGEKILESLLSH